MKKQILLLLAFLVFSTIQAQKDIYFKISHKIDNQPFSTTVEGLTDSEDYFSISKLFYYVSRIKIIHDGGQEILVDSTWIFVNAEDSTDILLGNYPVTSLEGVKFSIGVESEFNHLDPTLYDSEHPLAPKSPSMHWGWSSGYRFLALEGYCKAQNYQLHALGDVNYFEQTVLTTGEVSGNDITIHIEGNYENAVSGIDLISGPIVHAETGEAKDAIVNFRDKVFDIFEVDSVNSISENIQNILESKVYPNPTNSKNRFIIETKSNDANVTIYSQTGAIVLNEGIKKYKSIDTERLVKGNYFVIIIDNKTSQMYKSKLVIN